LLRGRDVDEIESLRGQGLSILGISQLMGIDRKTVRKYLLGPRVPRYGPRQSRISLLGPYEDYIKQRLAAGVWNAVVLLRELRERGYAGHYTILTDYIRPLRREAANVAVRRFETPPGKQAQVDWGILGDMLLPGGSRVILNGFVMTLGNSRGMYLDFSADQKLATFLSMHERAFEALGGIPQQILYDNVKTAKLGTDARGEVVLHPAFADFARYWGFEPRFCRPYRAQTKGKVESGIGYVRKNFLCGRTADDLEDLRRQGWAWAEQVANARVHGTTHRVVREAWEEEKAHLMPLGPRPAFVFTEEETRRVSRDAFVHYGGCRYSVPWPLAGKEVTVVITGGRLCIWRAGQNVASHDLADRKRLSVVAPGHHEGIPAGGSGRCGRKQKPMLHLLVTGAPTVEVRSLSVYEAVAQGGVR